MRYLLSLLFITSLLNASMFLGSKNLCIEDYFIMSGNFYYIPSHQQGFFSDTSFNPVATIKHNYIYDPNSDICKPDLSVKMGLTIEQFNFLMALIGVIFGGIFMFFTIQAFTSVGGKR